MRFVKIKSSVQQRTSRRGGRVGAVSLAEDGAMDEQESDGDIPTAEREAASVERAALHNTRGPKLRMQLPDGSSQAVGLDLTDINTMRQLQTMVLGHWAEAGNLLSG